MDLATVDEAKGYIGDTATGKEAMLAILVDGTAEQIKAYCRKTEGFKASTKLAHLKWIAREFTVMVQGANGISSESISGISTTYLPGIPEDITQALNLDKRVIVK